MAVDSFTDEAIKHFGGEHSVLDQQGLDTEAVPLTHFRVDVQNDFGLVPHDSGFPTHVHIEVLPEANGNPGNPTDAPRLMLWIGSRQPGAGQRESLLMGMSLPTGFARQLAAELLRGADWVDAEPEL